VLHDERAHCGGDPDESNRRALRRDGVRENDAAAADRALLARAFFCLHSILFFSLLLG
jgi:hypothetical protein